MAGFLKKITGSEEDHSNEDNFDQSINYGIGDVLEEDREFDLEIDLYENEDNLFIKTFVPGIAPRDINIDVTRDLITISGERVNQDTHNYDYFSQGLPWGRFYKQISLPKEINIEKIKAATKNGLLTLKLPKVDKDRTIKISLD